MNKPHAPTKRGLGLRGLLAVLLVAAFTAVTIWGFLEGRREASLEAERERPIKAPLRVAAGADGPVITVDTGARQGSGIATGVPAPAPYREQIRAFGTVLDLARLTDLANSYANAQAQLRTAQAKLAVSKAEFAREQSLYKDRQIVSKEKFESAEGTLRSDEASVAAAESQVRTHAATAHQEWGPILAKALVDGAPLVTRLIERQEFLLQVTLPPDVKIAPPPVASAQISPDTRIDIAFISPATRTDPKIQGLSFFYSAAGDSGVMPGMNVLAFLPVGSATDGAAIPAAAIVWWQGRAWVYRRTGSDTFSRVEIPTDLPAAGGGYIVNSLPKDAEIVTQGAQLLLSEEFRAQIEVGEDKK